MTPSAELIAYSEKRHMEASTLALFAHCYAGAVKQLDPLRRDGEFLGSISWVMDSIVISTRQGSAPRRLVTLLALPTGLLVTMREGQDAIEIRRKQNYLPDLPLVQSYSILRDVFEFLGVPMLPTEGQLQGEA